MARANYLIDGEIFEYLKSVSIAESSKVAEVRLKTQQMRGWGKTLTADCGHMLRFMIQLTGARRCLDVGTFTGLSAILMAESTPIDAEIHTLEVNAAYIARARQNFSDWEGSDKIHLHAGAAEVSMRKLLTEKGEGYFDFAFIDADKKNNTTYLELAIEMLRVGGLIIVDNVFWYKQILDPECTDEETQSVRRFNLHCSALPYDSRIMIPLGDGLTLIRVSNSLKKMLKNNPLL